jgi:hypothetical protein
VIDEIGTNGLRVLSALFQRPLVNVNYIGRVLDVSFPTANRLVARFEELGLLREVTGQKRSRLFRYEPYLRLFDDPTMHDEDTGAPPEVTEPSQGSDDQLASGSGPNE